MMRSRTAQELHRSALFAAGWACARTVGGERGEVRIGPCGKHLADPYVQLVPGQPALHERGLDGVDHVLAVSVRRPQTAVIGYGCGHLVARFCDHRPTSPREQCKKSVTRPTARLLP